MNNSSRDEQEVDMDLETSELSECLLNSSSYPEEEQQLPYQSAEPARLSTNHSAEKTKQTSTTEATSSNTESVHPQRQSSNEGTDRTQSSTQGKNHNKEAATETSQQMQLHHSSESPSETVGKSTDHSSESISSSHNGLVSQLFSSSPSSAMVSESASLSHSGAAVPEPVPSGHSGAGGWALEPVVPHSGHSSGALELPARRGECWCPLPSREPPCGSCVSWLGRTDPPHPHRLSALTADSGCGLVSVPEDALLTQVPVLVRCQ
jgi:hypothetical protein